MNIYDCSLAIVTFIGLFNIAWPGWDDTMLLSMYLFLLIFLWLPVPWIVVGWCCIFVACKHEKEVTCKFILQLMRSRSSSVGCIVDHSTWFRLQIIRHAVLKQCLVIWQEIKNVTLEMTQVITMEASPWVHSRWLHWVKWTFSNYYIALPIQYNSRGLPWSWSW